MEAINQGGIINLLKSLYNYFNLDPRRLQFIFLWSYSVIALEVFNHERSHWVTISTFLATLTTDKVLSHFFHKHKNSWLPSAIISPSICTLCYSPIVLPYIFAGVISALSKTFFTYKGRHVFNPSNFGISVTLLLFPNWLTGIINVFSGIKYIGIYFFISGFINAINSKSLHISLSYLVGLFLGLLFKGIFIDSHLNYYVLTQLTFNPILLIFAFHMINDPATTPKSKKWGTLYGFFLGVAWVVMSYFGSTHAHFFSLFIFTLFVPFIRDYEERVQIPDKVHTTP